MLRAFPIDIPFRKGVAVRLVVLARCLAREGQTERSYRFAVASRKELATLGYMSETDHKIARNLAAELEASLESENAATIRREAEKPDPKRLPARLWRTRRRPSEKP